ncbi:MAG: hypothetical protein MUC50_05555 [Myxococcota bacterium]|jgi:hypothetical protein|nr:hypothetical protein [Myxococcota bacterium]
MKRLRFFLLLLLLLLPAACQEQPPDNPISQFERPQNVALVCWEGELKTGSPVALDVCRDAANNDKKRVLAFVTQTTPGEVAMVNLTPKLHLRNPDEINVDQDERIPYASFIPVGGMPTGIAATADGTTVITANAETEDLSLIDVRRVFDGILFPTIAVDLGGAPSHLVVARVAGIDYVFATLPLLHRLAVVRLTAAQDEGENPSGKLLGWLQFAGPTGIEDTDSLVEAETATDTLSAADTLTATDTLTAADTLTATDTLTTVETDTETASSEDEPVLPTLSVPTLDGQPFSPSALASAAQSLFMGASNAAAILELDFGVLVQRAESLSAPGALPEDALIRAVSLEGALRSFTTTELSVEPGETPRWLYAVENELGGLLAIDLLEGLLVEANAGDRKAADPESIKLPGRAINVELLTFAEEGDAYDPLTFDGTFAVASTTMAAIYVLDVYDRKSDPDFNSQADPALFHPHSIRSRANLDKTLDASDTDSSGTRYMTPPAVSAGGQTYQGDKAADFLYFEGDGTDSASEPNTDTTADSETATDTDSDVDTETAADTETQSAPQGEDALPEGFIDGGPLLPGLAMRENPRDWVRDDWLLTYQGAIGISGAAVADFSADAMALGGPETALVVFDDTKDFCAMGLKAGRGVRGEPVGDLFYVTSKPTPPLLASNCESLFGDVETSPLVYQIARVLDPHTIIVVNNGRYPKEGTTNMLSIDCYGQAFNYEIRAADHYILKGSLTGHLYTPGELDTDSQICTMPDDSDGRRQRVFVDERFTNYYFSFILREGPALPELYKELEKDTDTKDKTPEVVLGFATAGGFAPLSFVVGNRVTDIAPMPDGTLVFIDQAAPALITFDMLLGFTPTQESIN